MVSITDGAWLKHAFMYPLRKKSKNTNVRQPTSAAFKFTNTSLGGNWPINNPPQFTPNADIRLPGRGRTDAQSIEGMGGYYSEAIDDPKQVIHMTFGVPRYNSLSTFFLNFYDANSARLANTGRASAAFYNLGLLIGYIVTLPLQPFLLIGGAASRLIDFLSKSEPSKWYYFKPTMHTYWASVNTIANEMAINLGLVARVFSDDQKELMEPGETQDQQKRMIRELHRIFPDIMREGGGIDCMTLANSTQRRADRANLAVQQAREGARSADDAIAITLAAMNQPVIDPNPGASAKDYFEKYVSSLEGSEGTKAGSETFSSWSKLKELGSFAVATQRDGTQFASFRVEHRDSMTESFNNTVRESDIATTLNTKVSQARSASFTLMSGNITPALEGFKSAIGAVMAGGLDSVGLGGIATLFGSAYLDLPKTWDGSTANLPTAEYTIPLYSPYGNKISRFINMYIPIAMMMAGALPRSAGRAAYAMPLLCQIFHQGRVRINNGMIDSFTITRGKGSVGYNAEGDMLGAEMTIRVVDMSSIMHVPIKGSFASPNWIGTAIRAGISALGGLIAGNDGVAGAQLLTNSSVWDEESTLSAYLGTMAGLPLADSYYAGKRLMLNATIATEEFKRWSSMTNFAGWLLDGGTARGISAFAEYTDRI